MSSDVTSADVGRTIGPRSARRRLADIGRLGVYLALILWTLGQVLPLVFLFINAFKTDAQIVLHPLSLPDTPHFENFTRMLFEGSIYQPMAPYLVNSFIVTGMTLVLLTTVSAMAAFGLARYSFPGRELIYRLILLTLAVPVHAALIPVFVLMGTLGLRNNLLGIALLYSAFWLPLTVVVLRAYFGSFPSEVLDAARVDGAGEFRLFRKIVIPMSRGAISSMAIVNFVGIWSELLFAFIILNKSTSQTITVGLLGYTSQYATDHALVFAAMAAATLPTLLFYLIFQRQITRGMTMGAIR